MAIGFNGTSDYITWGDIDGLDLLDKLTVSFMLYHDAFDTTDFSGWIHKYNENGAGDQGWGIMQTNQANDLLIFARNSDVSYAFTNTAPLTYNA